MSASAHKFAFRAYCEASRAPMSQKALSALYVFMADDAVINLVHPFNEMDGPNAYSGLFLKGLGSAFQNLRRSEYIAFGGSYSDAEWVTCTGYYTGHFINPWLGISPTGTLAHLRFGEFHRMEGGKAVESYIFLDIPELMIAAGQWPIAESPGNHRGFTGYLPGPSTQDGLVWGDTDAAHSASSYQMVTDMLRSLATEEEAWRPYWTEDMLWYGPAAFGSFVGLEEFAGFQRPFEQAFSEWIGGSVKGSETKHFTRFADGDYICSGGWPSLNVVQAKPFLGQPVVKHRLYMRVCDWWRREGDLLSENWVFVDIPHVLLQMGFDVFAELERKAA